MRRRDRVAGEDRRQLRDGLAEQRQPLQMIVVIRHEHRLGANHLSTQPPGRRGTAPPTGAGHGLEVARTVDLMLANRGWSPLMTQALTDIGVLKTLAP